MTDLLPPGTSKPDFADPHYRFMWRAQLDSFKGPWVTQLDADGRERSVKHLDWARVVRIELRPQHAGLPILEVRADLGLAERALKKWQCEISTPPHSSFVVREVLGLQLPVAMGSPSSVSSVYLIYEPADNRLILTTNQNL